METYLQKILLKPLSELPTYSDVGRLGKRIELNINGDFEVPEVPENFRYLVSDALSSSSSSDSHALQLSRVLTRVVLSLECNRGVEYLTIILQAIEKFRTEVGDQPDIQFFVRDLFQSFDMDGSTVRLFKFVNQATLVHAITNLKLTVSQRESYLTQDKRLTKDVRGANGWQIDIKIANDSVCVSHVRREQGLGKPIWEDDWEVHWRLDISFSPDMRELLSSRIVIVDLVMGPKLNARDRAELARLFAKGELTSTPSDAPPVVPVTNLSANRPNWRSRPLKCTIS